MIDLIRNKNYKYRDQTKDICNFFGEAYPNNTGVLSKGEHHYNKVFDKGFMISEETKLADQMPPCLKTESKKNVIRGRSHPNEERTPEIATKRSSRIADNKIIYFQEKFVIKKPT
jgi:hypothetical protein